VSHRPFSLRNKPKSLLVCFIAVLSALVVCLIGIIAANAEILWLFWIAAVLFLACWAISVVSTGIFFVRWLQGRYRRIVARPWREQVW
jgi:hypothetical protein